MQHAHDFLPYRIFAKLNGCGERTVRRWITEPDKYRISVDRREHNGRLIAFVRWHGGSERKPEPAKENAPECVPLKCDFDRLLNLKLSGKSPSAQRSMKSRYTKEFQATGRIPQPLLLAGEGILEGRKASGRKRAISEPVKTRFAEMVKNASDPEHPEFITKNLRKITNFIARLCEEFPDEEIPYPSLANLAKKLHLKKYLEKDDFSTEVLEKIWYFKDRPVMDLIQMDGCQSKYVEIKDEEGKFKPIRFIEFFDTGSRMLLCMEAYFSESNESSIDVFSKFLTTCTFPQKTVKLRPDNAKGFLNLARPVHELNRKYSKPGRFFMDADFARVGKPKDKVHLESSHKLLHNWEDRIIRENADRVASRRPGVKFKSGSGKMEKVTITQLNMTLAEFRDTGFCQRYMDEHNNMERRFTVNGKTEKWVPSEKLALFLQSSENLRFTSQDVESFVRYGFQKQKASVSPEGRIRYSNRDWYVVDGNFYGGATSTKVVISDVGGKLCIFGADKDGLYLCDAMPVKEFTKTEKVERAESARVRKNEYELLSDFLIESGMAVNHEQLRMQYRNGLNLAAARQLVEKNNHKYQSYGAGFIAFNLLISDYMAMAEESDLASIPAYAELGGI